MSDGPAGEAPPVPALYRCEIRHARRSPLRHTLRHRTYLWLIDPAAVPVPPRGLRALARFDPRDHFDGTAPSIAAGLERFLTDHGEPPPGGPTLMLAHARVFGYVFNPLTLYWCHHRDGSLACVVAEVHNTYGKRHAYLLHPDGAGRAVTDKRLAVSPFFTVAGRYRMRLPVPGDRLRLTVTLDQPGEKPFTAAVTGVRRPAGARGLLRAAVRHPWSTLAVSAAIRAHGITLYLRGLRVRRHDPVPERQHPVPERSHASGPPDGPAPGGSAAGHRTGPPHNTHDPDPRRPQRGST
ncbi:DUF1365 domain-containing protein [Streptomyces sp. JH002]|uniref:DUF1365 domain-containing protein n=1 Tax=Streptomyces sp. JH002 TaxID=2763259 RepID=UPI003D800B5B